jgi:hypothetical protein
MGDTVSTLLFQPPPPTKLKENKIIWLKTSKGKRIPGFYIHFSNFEGEDVSRSLTVKELQSADTSEGITILYSHANAEDLGSIYPWCKFLSKMLRVNLFAYDYTGYGMAYEEGEQRNTAVVQVVLRIIVDRHLFPGGSCMFPFSFLFVREPF